MNISEESKTVVEELEAQKAALILKVTALKQKIDRTKELQK